LIWFSTLSTKSSYATVLISLVLFRFRFGIICAGQYQRNHGLGPGRETRRGQRYQKHHQPDRRRAQRAVFLLLMTLVIPYNKLTQIIGGSQLVNAADAPSLLKAINRACLILGVITLLAIIPALQTGRQKSTEKRIDGGQ